LYLIESGSANALVEWAKSLHNFMQIATWNVNSIRTRLDIVTQWLQRQPVDVLCLQETKVTDEQFPLAAFTDLGYQVYISGQKSYNGVALVSRQPLSDISCGFGGVLDEVGDLDEQKRVIRGKIGDVTIVNLYVPNGSEVGSEKYEYKLQWLAMLQKYLSAQPDRQLCVCGDFNIALSPLDIYNKRKEKDIMASPLERAALQAAVLDRGLQDVFRHFTTEGGHFSWWDYRQQGYSKNRGWRIDHIYLSPELLDRSTGCTIDKAPRELNQPSDHTPVIVDLI
jgi:exodeoxyribonuclease III